MHSWATYTCMTMTMYIVNSLAIGRGQPHALLGSNGMKNQHGLGSWQHCRQSLVHNHHVRTKSCSQLSLVPVLVTAMPLQARCREVSVVVRKSQTIDHIAVVVACCKIEMRLKKILC